MGNCVRNRGWVGGFAPLGHLHDGDILEHDGVDSDGGAFPFDSTDTITFNKPIIVGGTLDSTATLDIIPSGLRDVKFYDESGVGVSQTVTFYGRNAGLLKFMALRVGLSGIADFNGNVDLFKFNNDVVIAKDQDSVSEVAISNDNSGTDIVHSSFSLYDGITQKAYMEFWNNSEEMHVGTLGANSQLFLESGNGVQAMFIDENQHIQLTPANSSEGLEILGVQVPKIHLRSSSDSNINSGEIRFSDLADEEGSVIRENLTRDILEFYNRAGGANTPRMSIGAIGVAIGDITDDSTPDDLLHVVDDIAGPTTIRIDNDDDDGSTRIVFYDGDDLEAHVQYINNGDILTIGNDKSGGEVAISSDTDVEAIRIDSGQRVGIGTSTPNADSILDLTSTTGALIVPRMTTAQRGMLTAANAMIVYDTTLNAFSFYENGVWVTK